MVSVIVLAIPIVIVPVVVEAIETVNGYESTAPKCFFNLDENVYPERFNAPPSSLIFREVENLVP
jgi:hypothetical protein